MSELLELERIRRARAYVRAFGPALEPAFRDAMREFHRYPRAIVFLAASIGFGVGPMYDTQLLRPLAPVTTDLRVLVAIVSALCGAAGLLTLSSAWLWLRRLAQITGVVALWGAILGLRAWAHLGQLSYPAEMSGVVVVAVAFFGGFRSRVIAPAGALYLAAAIALELRSPSPDAYLSSFSLFYLGLIGAGGSFTYELLWRVAWVNQRYATLLARTDGLTGMESRSSFERRFARVVARASQRKTSVAVALVDIDGFKSINDRHGHLAGDQVLRHLSLAIRERFAAARLDICARYGGDEFVFVMLGASREQAQLRIEAVLQAVHAEPIALTGGAVVQVAASGGLASFEPGCAVSPEAMLREADHLLYAAKAAGKNRLRFRHHDDEAAPDDGHAPAGAGLQPLAD